MFVAWAALRHSAHSPTEHGHLPAEPVITLGRFVYVRPSKNQFAPPPDNWPHPASRLYGFTRWLAAMCSWRNGQQCKTSAYLVQMARRKNPTGDSGIWFAVVVWQRQTARGAEVV